jgi:hypothetical protein
MVLVCCLSAGCGRNEPIASVPEIVQEKPAVVQSEPEPEAIPLPHIQSLTEMTHEEMQKELVGTWQFKDKGALPLLSARTLGLLGAPLDQGPLLAACALLPGKVGEVTTVIAFDAQGRVHVLDNAADAWVVDMDFLQGKVRCEIEMPGVTPRLKIVRPGTKGNTVRVFEIKRLKGDELDLLESGDGVKPEVATFRRIDRDTPAIIDDAHGSREPIQP